MIQSRIKYYTLLVGIILEAIVLLGAFTAIGGYKSYQPRPWERFDPLWVAKIHSLQELLLEAEKRAGSFEKIDDERKMKALSDIVIERFTHGRANHTLFTNWILWLAGKINSTLGAIWDPEIMLAKGHSLYCSQSSYVLMQSALKAGIRARHVGLNGHVVMEAWYDDDWHMYDPDAEVIPQDANNRILSADELAKTPVILANAYSGIKTKFISFIASRQDNTYVSYPVGAYFEWKSQVLLYVEKMMQVLKYLLPLLFIGFGLIPTQKKTKASNKKDKTEYKK